MNKKMEMDIACKALRQKIDALKARETYLANNSAPVYGKGKTLLVKRGNK